MLILAAVALMAGLLGAVPAQQGCPDVGTWTTTCDLLNTGGGVNVGDSLTNPGSGGSDNNSHDNANRGNLPEAPPDPPCTELCDRGNYSVGLITDGLPAVTLADLVSFVPAKPTLQGEPAGIGVVGMPTNFVASASEQLMGGRLFDTFDVVVRFTPASFRFTYGDGTSLTSAAGGTAWTTLGQADFTPTATSHVYAARGTYPVAVSVSYSAAVDFGTGWIPIDGFVDATTGGYDVRVVEVHTALVDRTCLENPAGPGC